MSWLDYISTDEKEVKMTPQEEKELKDLLELPESQFLCKDDPLKVGGKEFEYNKEYDWYITAEERHNNKDGVIKVDKTKIRFVRYNNVSYGVIGNEAIPVDKLVTSRFVYDNGGEVIKLDYDYTYNIVKELGML